MEESGCWVFGEGRYKGAGAWVRNGEYLWCEALCLHEMRCGAPCGVWCGVVWCGACCLTNVVSRDVVHLVVCGVVVVWCSVV